MKITFILLLLCFVNCAVALCPSGETSTRYLTMGLENVFPPSRQLITQEECEALAAQAEKSFSVQNDATGWYPNGCFTLWGDYRYGVNGIDACGANDKYCIVYNDVPAYKIHSSGELSGTPLTQNECDTYSIEHGFT